MKRFITRLIIFIGIVYFAEKYFSLSDRLLPVFTENKQITVSKDELASALDDNQQLAAEVTDLRKDFFSILVAMNSITDDALTLSRSREGDNLKGETISKQIHAKLKMLRQQVEDARQKARVDEELQQECDRLEKSLFEKEREIRRLTSNIVEVDAKIDDAIRNLESENQKLREKEQELRQVNDLTIKTINERISADQRAWITAGDELVWAAKTIPRPNSKLFDGDQSRAIVKAKLLLLKSAQKDCYNVAIRISRSTPNAHEAERKGQKAHELFELASIRKDIGESYVIDSDD